MRPGLGPEPLTPRTLDPVSPSDEAQVVDGAGGQHDGEHVGRQVVVQEERVVDHEEGQVVEREPGQQRLTQRAHLAPLGCEMVQ